MEDYRQGEECQSATHLSVHLLGDFSFRCGPGDRGKSASALPSSSSLSWGDSCFRWGPSAWLWMSSRSQPPHPGGLTPHRTSRGPLSLNLRSSPSRLSLTQTPYPLSPYPPTPQSPKPNPQPLSLILRPPVTRDLCHWPPGDASTRLGAFSPRMYLPFNVLKSLRSGPNLRDRYMPRPSMRWQKLRPVDPIVLELRT